MYLDHALANFFFDDRLLRTRWTAILDDIYCHAMRKLASFILTNRIL